MGGPLAGRRALRVHPRGAGRLRGRSLVAIDAALRRLKKADRIRSPRRGFLVIVPIDYRASCCPPPSWFVADLMRFLDQPHYVGILSATALHGASHQQPMAFHAESLLGAVSDPRLRTILLAPRRARGRRRSDARWHVIPNWKLEIDE